MQTGCTTASQNGFEPGSLIWRAGSPPPESSRPATSDITNRMQITPESGTLTSVGKNLIRSIFKIIRLLYAGVYMLLHVRVCTSLHAHVYMLFCVCVCTHYYALVYTCYYIHMCHIPCRKWPLVGNLNMYMLLTPICNKQISIMGVVYVINQCRLATKLVTDSSSLILCNNK